MTARIDPFAAAPAAMKSWMNASFAIDGSVDPTLAELVKIRSSQINGCANCINMHTADARAKGETEQRIYLLSAWREAPCYSERERRAGVDRGVDAALRRSLPGERPRSAGGAF